MDTLQLEDTRTLSQRIKKPRIYDEKDLWVTYHSWGRAATHQKLLDYASSKGMFSSEKGKPSHMGPLWAMWRYAFNHPKEAYPHWEAWMKEYPERLGELGITVDFDTFIREVRRVVKENKIYKGRTFDAWCDEWGLSR